MQQIPKQSRYLTYPALELLCNSLCGPRTKNWETPALNNTKKTFRRFVRALQALCALCLPWKTQQIHAPNCFIHSRQKIKRFRWIKIWHLQTIWYLCGNVCDMPSTVWWLNRKQISKKCQHTVALRTNEITGTIAAKSSYGGTIQCSTVPFNRTTLFQLSGYLWR